MQGQRELDEPYHNVLHQSDPCIMVKHLSCCKLKHGISHRLQLVAEKQHFVEYKRQELEVLMPSLLLEPRWHFCLFSYVLKINCSSLWLLLLLPAQQSATYLAFSVTAGGVKTQFTPCALGDSWRRCATAHQCASGLGRACVGDAGGCSCRFLSAWGLNLPQTEACTCFFC